MGMFYMIVVLVWMSLSTAAENTIVDFKSIKKVIKNDMLTETVKEKVNDAAIKKNRVDSKKKAKYNIPGEDEFWGFASEYWLIKNAALLKWDFEKPDYGIDTAFAAFLKKMGFYEKKFKILLINTPDVTHFALPANPNEYIFLISVPFMRVLDLSKQDICLLLFEDFLRLRFGYFKDYVRSEDLEKLLGGNFIEKKLKMKPFSDLMKKYDEIIFDKGFTFQQQFEVTKQFDKILKSDLNLWNSYITLLKKIDNLIKANLLYEKYARIYPSPELQISWLVPAKKVLE